MEKGEAEREQGGDQVGVVGSCSPVTYGPGHSESESVVWFGVASLLKFRFAALQASVKR